MDFTQYLTPNEPVALGVIGVQFGLFLVWLLSFIVRVISDMRALREARTFQTQRSYAVLGDAKEIFSSVDKRRSARPSGSPKNWILREHLSSLAETQAHEAQSQVNGIINNTINKFTASSSWLRSVLSLFIILGLLGTLWGLASTLSHLSMLGPGGQQLTNDSLADGLKVLLSKLGGAFAPSIWGVGLTAIGIFIFSLYTRFVSLPLKLTVEELTLRRWAPALAKHGVDEKALMKRNIEAAQQIGSAAESIRDNIDKLVVTFNDNLPAIVENLANSVNQISEKFSNDASELADDVRKAGKTLKALTAATENLNTFSETFKTSVESLYPFSDASKLRELYEALLDRSGAMIEHNTIFQERVHEQLDLIAANENRLEQAVGSFHEIVLAAASEIATEVGGTSAAAKEAFDRLGAQNDSVIRELVEQVGRPVSEALMPMPVTLNHIVAELQRVNTPLEGVKSSIEQSSFAVIKFADERLAHMDDKLIAQVQNLEMLANRIDALGSKFDDIGVRMDNFNAKAGQMDATIASFIKKSDGISEKFGDFDRKIERAIATTGRTYTPSSQPTSRKNGFLRRVKTKLFG